MAPPTLLHPGPPVPTRVAQGSTASALSEMVESRSSVIPRAADAVLVQRRREASLEAVLTTVQLEANADCDSGICSLQH